ncbi:MAG: sugar ABC transporter substrate-binding protein, partial [Peptococcales bacterium]
MNKKLFHIILMILFIFFLTGCWGAPQAKPQLKPKGKIGFLVAETKSARNQYLMTQMKKEATHQKLKLFTGDSKLDPKIQETQIEKMIKEKVQVLIFQPLNVEETKEQINRLLEKNIKIILLDFLPLDVTVDAFIAPDYLRAGELQAQFVVGQGKQVTPYVLKGDPLNYLSDKILQGNKNILQNNSLVDIFIIREITNKYEQQSYQSLKNEFDQISPNVLISHYEEITMGVIKFLKEIAKEQQLMVLSLDINQELLPELAKGNLTIVDTMPNLLVTVILETADSLLNNKTWNYDLQINNGSALIPTK